MNPQGQEWNFLNTKITKITLQAKDTTQWLRTIWFTNLFLSLKRWKIPDATAAVDKEWKKLGTIPALQLEEVNSKKDVILATQRDKKQVNFATLMDVRHLKNAELETKFQKYKGRVVLRGEHFKRRLCNLRSLFRTRLVCVTNDCRKSNGCYC